MLGRFWSKSKNRQFWHNFSESRSWKNRYLKNWKKSKSNLRIAKIKKTSNRTNCGHIFDSTKTFCNFVAILHRLLQGCRSLLKCRGAWGSLGVPIPPKNANFRVLLHFYVTMFWKLGVPVHPRNQGCGTPGLLA